MTLTETRQKPGLGFLGVGWIGRSRMKAILDADVATPRAIAEPSATNAADALAAINGDTPAVVETLDDLLALPLDGVVIATPSALHAEQAIAAFERGYAVFCQKPLGRTADEVRRVVDAARAADLLLGVDLSYRYTAAARALYDLAQSGALGRIYAVNLVFHNAYGPDKAWFYDPALSGGGCVIDLGIHLVDLALWLLGFPAITHVTSRLFAKGTPLSSTDNTVEDYATAQLDLADGATVGLTCSWNLPAGCDAVIEVSLYGTAGGARLHNVNGSFYDFEATHLHGTQHTTIATPPDDWSGRAAVDWAARLAAGDRFDPAAEQFITVAEALDAIYAGDRSCVSS